MDVLVSLGQGFSVALMPLNLLMAFSGAFLGTVIGMLPGIGPINGVAILIPITFALNLPPASMLILFAGIYYGAQYGNSISAILLNIPGTSTAVLTALEGNALAKKGQAGPALAMSAIASFVGGTLAVVGLMLFAPLLAQWALRFGPAEYFALMVFAFMALSALGGKSLVKSLISSVFGLMLATVGLDPQSAVPRYTFGELRLYDGLDFVIVTLGFFAVSEVIVMLEESRAGQEARQRVGRVMLKAAELLESTWTILRSSVAGFLIGVLPGAGATIASFVAYSTERRLHEHDGTFGEGDLRGVAAPEAANNAASVGAFVPMLTLGVPGSETTAIILAALLGMNITPGPLLIGRHPEIFWGLVASMYIGNVMLLVLNLPLVGLFARLLVIPRWALLPGVTALSFVAVYAVSNSSFNLFLMIVFGILGYGMRKLEFPLAHVLLGLILGPLMEVNLRRALTLSGGQWGILVSSPLTVALWILSLLSLVLPPVLQRLRAARSDEAGRRADEAR